MIGRAVAIGRLREQRAGVEKFLADDASRQKYQTAAGKLGTIRAVLQANVFKPNQTYEFPCLGMVLGDAFVQELKMEWVMVEDHHGRDQNRQRSNANLFCHVIVPAFLRSGSAGAFCSVSDFRISATRLGDTAPKSLPQLVRM